MCGKSNRWAWKLLDFTSMRAYSVYRFESVDHKVLRVGTILELRRVDRGLNRISLTKLARKIFGRGSGDIIFLGEEQDVASSAVEGAADAECCAG